MDEANGVCDADRNFCLRRADEERARADASETPEVAERHAYLAKLYELRADDPAAWMTLSTLISA
jgi:hypothetical protein